MRTTTMRPKGAVTCGRTFEPVYVPASYVARVVRILGDVDDDALLERVAQFVRTGRGLDG